MFDFFNFIVESGISLGIFSLVYFVFLKNETFFRLNRVYLVLSVLFSCLLPFLHLEPGVEGIRQLFMPAEAATPEFVNLLDTVTVYGNAFSGTATNTLLSYRGFLILYFSGIVCFTLLFIVKLVKILWLVHTSKVHRVNGCRLVETGKEGSPFSFFKFVFIPKNVKDGTDWEKMLSHELEHVRQRHSADIIALEAMAVLQWFNPFVWLFKRLVRENHEYLADRAVLSSGVSRGKYKLLLLGQVLGEQPQLANNFNYSLIKNRIKMMTKIKSSKIATIKVLTGFVAAVVLVVAFAIDKPVYAQDNKKKTVEEKTIKIEKKEYSADDYIYAVVEQMPEYPGGQMVLRKYIAENIKYPKEAQKKGIQGKVFVGFVVDKKGNVTDVKIVKGVDEFLDKEAVRVVKAMPKWKPGKEKGKPVNVNYTVPINFALK